MGRRMATNTDRPRDGEPENLAGSPIWNLQAGDDILPANKIMLIIAFMSSSNEFTRPNFLT